MLAASWLEHEDRFSGDYRLIDEWISAGNGFFPRSRFDEYLSQKLLLSLLIITSRALRESRNALSVWMKPCLLLFKPLSVIESIRDLSCLFIF